MTVKSQTQAWLITLLIINLVSTAFHYTDNFFFFEQYPAPTWMETNHVYITWLILTPFAIAGYFFYTKCSFLLAYLCLGIYSITGTSSLGHYFFSSPIELSGKMNALICLDVISGLALLSFLVWSAFFRQEWRQVT